MTEGEAPIRDAPKEPGSGQGACYDDEIPRLRFAPLGMTGGCRYGVGLEGDDSGGEGIMMDSRPRLHGGRLFAGKTGGVLPSSSRGQVLRGDDGGGWCPRETPLRMKGWETFGKT